MTPYIENEISDPEASADHYKPRVAADLEAGGGPGGSGVRRGSDSSEYKMEKAFGVPATQTHVKSVHSGRTGHTEDLREIASIQSGSSASLDGSGDGTPNNYGTMPTAPLVPTSTPRFHFDLHTAVKAAEKSRKGGPTLGDTR